MHRSRRALSLLAALALTVATASAVTAAQKGGCPAAQSGWRLTTPDAAADEFFGHLVGAPFVSPEEFAAVIAANDDTNRDGLVCIRRSWGEELNPNAHWYGHHVLSVTDNKAAAELDPES